MIRRPPSSPLERRSAASDVYKRQVTGDNVNIDPIVFDGMGIASYGVNASGADNLVVDGNTFQNFVGDGDTTGFGVFVSNSDDIKIEVYDNNSIKDWVNENIGSVAFVQDLNDIRRLEGFRTWNEWAKTLEGAEVKYQRDATIDNNLSAIIDSIIIGKPFRLIGHSGLGKTRLALEAFRQIEFMRTQVLYFEIGINGQLVDLTNFIISNKTKDGIIVIDGCDEEEHQILSGLVKKLSKFKLLTIDIANESNELSYLKLERNFQREIVKKIIDDFLGLSHDQSDRDYPVSYTHLRAHETVLDIVCRLLLEKKKNKKQSHNINYTYTH